jgi:hypothetical protein
MDENDNRVVSFEEAARRRRAAEEAQGKKGVIREVKLSDAMNHLLDDRGPESDDPAGAAPAGPGAGEEGTTPEELRRIVEREFADEGGRGAEPEKRPRPHLVGAAEEENGGRLCSFETRRCWDPVEFPQGPPE